MFVLFGSMQDLKMKGSDGVEWKFWSQKSRWPGGRDSAGDCCSPVQDAGRGGGIGPARWAVPASSQPASSTSLFPWSCPPACLVFHHLFLPSLTNFPLPAPPSHLWLSSPPSPAAPSALPLFPSRVSLQSLPRYSSL